MPDEEPDFSDVYPHEVMDVINRKDDIRSYFIEDIFEETVRLGYEANDKVVAIEIELGEEGVAGQPRWQLDWLIQKIKAATLQELAASKAILPDYGIELRGTELFAVINYIPKNFLAWYGGELLASHELGEIVAYHPALVRELNDIPAAIYYAQLRRWWEQASWVGWDGFMPKSVSEIQKATGLKKDAQIRVRELLESKGWLEAKERRIGRSTTLHFKTFHPLDFTEGKPDSVIAGKVRQFKLSKAIDKEESLYWQLQGFQMEFIGLADAMRDMSVRKLWNNASDKRSGELGEVLGKGSGKYAAHGDEMIDTKDHVQYHGDLHAAEGGYETYNQMRKQKNALAEQIKQTEQQLKEKQREIKLGTKNTRDGTK